jgi:methionyl-tRNA synthetase
MAPRVYLTTPIYYVSDVPHLGHAYTTIVTDALARFHRMRGTDTRFLTGTDNHGQKIERMAAAHSQPPKQYADAIGESYRRTWQTLGITNDDFIRTTDPDHEAVVQELWQVWEKNGDVYLGHYEGWYCVACEQYYTEKELGEGNTCPVHRRPVEKIKEESLFFRLSAYQKKLQEFYDGVLAATGKPFIEPQIRMNEVRAFVDAGLNDFSASRTNFTWGVPVPNHPGSVVYVWVDALTNYYSATRRKALDGFWGDDATIVHLMGKEITRFHAVYWPAMLMAAGLRPPSKIIAHGWWTVDGEKMSKTSGNVVDPNKLAADVGADAFRYFVLREVPLGADGDFSHEALITRYNAELANDLGNLLNRTLGMVAKYLGSEVPAHDPEREGDLPSTAAGFAAREMSEAMLAYQPSKALEAIWKLVRSGNEFIDKAAPWKQDKARQAEILWIVLNTCRVLSHLVEPFMPERAVEMRRQIGVTDGKFDFAEPWKWSSGFTVTQGTPLFPRIDEDKKRELLAKWMPKKTEVAAPQKENAATQQSGNQVSYDEFAKLDLRVGEIVAATKVPKKDKLLQLTVDLGSEKRQVVAGIAVGYAPETLVGKRVIFLANLKPAKIGGVMSEGMILAAGEGETMALSALDRTCAPGTKVK